MKPGYVTDKEEEAPADVQEAQYNI